MESTTGRLSRAEELLGPQRDASRALPRGQSPDSIFETVRRWKACAVECVLDPEGNWHATRSGRRVPPGADVALTACGRREVPMALGPGNPTCFRCRARVKRRKKVAAPCW